VFCYTYYLKDAHLGCLSIRVCPYFPFNLSVWINGHEYLACQLRHQGIAFRQGDNRFLDCADPARLQELSDGFGAEQITAALDPWFARLLPYFSAAERADGYRHHLVQRHIEYCHNMVFHDKAKLTKLFDRLMDHGRALGHPNKLAIIFGRRHFQIDTRTGEINAKVTRLRTPVLRADLEKTGVKQYVQEGAVLRTETSCFQLKDLSLRKGIDHLPRTREVLHQGNERLEGVQQDVLETYIDRGQLQELTQATVSASGRRTPGVRPHDPRLLALWQALLCFMHLVGKGVFKTAALLPDVQQALGNPDYKLSQLRYDLGKLRGKGLVQRVPGTQTYQLTATGYRLGLLFVKLHHRFYAPLTAGLVEPIAADNLMLTSKTAQLDRLYLAIDQALEKLSKHVGLAA
jgi:hypothetical protein